MIKTTLLMIMFLFSSIVRSFLGIRPEKKYTHAIGLQNEDPRFGEHGEMRWI